MRAGPDTADERFAIGVGIMSALLALAGETGRQWLRFERDGLAQGEFWRLVSGHLVHLGPTHTLMNVAALAVLWFVLKPFLAARDWPLAAIASAAVIDAGLYWVHGGIEWYVGLSGVLHGFWSAACVRGCLARRPDAWLLLALLLAKLGYEAVSGPVGLTSAIAAGPVVTPAHAWGALGGAGAILVAMAIRASRRWL